MTTATHTDSLATATGPGLVIRPEPTPPTDPTGYTGGAVAPAVTAIVRRATTWADAVDRVLVDADRRTLATAHGRPVPAARVTVAQATALRAGIDACLALADPDGGGR